MASITLSSTSFANGATIPQRFKATVGCAGDNNSPQFAWSIDGFVQGHVDYFNLYVEDVNMQGSSPNGKFLHWAVTHITKTVYSINENGFWLDPTTVILPTDYSTGDKYNGWNGTCASDGQHEYRIWIEAKINSRYAAFIWQTPPTDLIIKSNYYTFFDRPTNLVNVPNVSDCGTTVCPPGYERIGDICQLVNATTPIINPSLITTPVRFTTWGSRGTKFVRQANNYVFPLNGTTNSQYGMFDSNNVHVAMNAVGPAYVPNYPSTPTDPLNSLWVNTSNDPFLGRLNNSAVWPDIQGEPRNEWIGFSYCLELTETKTYCVGLSGDDIMRFTLNGQRIVQWESTTPIFDSHQCWYILEMELQAGTNLIEVEGLNRAVVGALGFEIYEATVDELMILDSIPALEPYIIFSSRNSSVEYFDIGENHGVSCPSGYAYNKCVGGTCTQITKRDLVNIECCWFIQNCINPSEQYAIRISSNYTDTIYLHSVYTFSGHAILFDSQTNRPKCFSIVDRVLCDIPDAVDVEVLTSFGDNACAICTNVLAFRKCTDDTIINVTLQSGQSLPVLNNVYKLNIASDCYVYIGEGTDSVQYNGVLITTDYQTDDCNVCQGCLQFRNCENSDTINVRLVFGENNPNSDEIGNIFELIGDELIDNRCWIFEGYLDCVNPDYTDVSINQNYGCSECRVCLPYYQLINCENSEDISYIYWSKTAVPLVEGNSYIFDFAPTTCYSAILQFGLCEASIEPVYDESNIVSVSDNCAECNVSCFMIVDCETQVEYFPNQQETVGAFVNRIIKWHSEAEPTITRCGVVSTIRCVETSELVVVDCVIEDSCFSTCEACGATPITEDNFSIPYRNINPGISVPSCSSEPIDTCGSTDITCCS